MKTLTKKFLLLLVLAACLVSVMPQHRASADVDRTGAGLQASKITRATLLGVASSSTLAQLDYYLNAFFDQYGITVSRTCPTSSAFSCASVGSESTSKYKDMATVIIQEWSKYTPAYVTATGIDGVVLVKDLSVPGTGVVGGLGYPTFNELFVNINFANQTDYPNYIQNVIHHEFFHVIDFALHPSGDTAWAALNTGGFTYIDYSGYAALPSPGDHPQAGFLHSYSMISVAEDKAVLYEHLFSLTRNIQMSIWAGSDSYLQDKIDYMRDQITSLDSSMDFDYFSGIYNYDPDIPLAASTGTVAANDTSSADIFVSQNETTTVDGQRGRTTVVSGGTLKGSGKVGVLDVLSGGHLAPGHSPGCMSSGNLTLSGVFDAEIGGTTACTSYDQVQVTGSVDVSGGTLATSLYNGYAPKVGETYTIIDNDGTDAVTGTFTGLAEGATFTVGGVVFKISYVGGTGNDVVLSALTVPDAPNTGLAFLKANPFMVLGATSVSAVSLIYLSRRMKFAPARRK